MYVCMYVMGRTHIDNSMYYTEMFIFCKYLKIIIINNNNNELYTIVYLHNSVRTVLST